MLVNNDCLREIRAPLSEKNWNYGARIGTKFIWSKEGRQYLTPLSLNSQTLFKVYVRGNNLILFQSKLGVEEVKIQFCICGTRSITIEVLEKRIRLFGYFLTTLLFVRHDPDPEK